MNYPMYGNNQFYMQDLQNMRDKIDRQMQQFQQLQQNQYQPQQPAPITQNFQLAPTQNNSNNELEGKYAENFEQVKNTFVIKTGVFVNKDFSKLWVKDVSGKIRTFDTQEILEIDDKDKEIIALKEQIKELKGMIRNEYDNANVDEQIAETKSSRVQSRKSSNAK